MWPHATNLQQITLKTVQQNYVRSLKMTVKILNGVENIVANGEIAHHEQFLHLPQCFQHFLIIQLALL